MSTARGRDQPPVNPNAGVYAFLRAELALLNRAGPSGRLMIALRQLQQGAARLGALLQSV